MNSLDPRKALDALASEHGLPILRYMRDGAWVHASQVAEALGIHTTTASKHLAAFYEAGFLERREHPAKRPTFAYRLKSPVIRLEFDLADRVESSDVVAVGSGIVEALLEDLERMGGTRLAGDLVANVLGGGDWRLALGRRLTSAPDPRSGLLTLIEDARRVLTGLVGAATAARLVRMAVDRAGEGRTDILATVGLAGVMP